MAVEYTVSVSDDRDLILQWWGGATPGGVAAFLTNLVATAIDNIRPDYQAAEKALALEFFQCIGLAQETDTKATIEQMVADGLGKPAGPPR